MHTCSLTQRAALASKMIQGENGRQRERERENDVLFGRVSIFVLTAMLVFLVLFLFLPSLLEVRGFEGGEEKRRSGL